MLTSSGPTARVIYSVSELNEMVRALLEDSFPPLLIEGEISNFACPASGHWYFSLKDSNAQVRCAMFQGRNRSLGFQPKNGMQIVVRAQLSLYAARGEYQLLVDWMEEAGDGALRRAYEQLKTKLATEGLFDLDHKKPLPTFSKCVGVITSPTGAAIQDILSVLQRRFPSLPIIIYPTAVQGTTAAAQIVHAIQIANQRSECDVLLLTRGGGSLEDLWSFNEESVARAIYASNIPIVSAVGHEIDFTIADFVADYRAPTPSAAAELISPDRNEWQLHLNKLCSILNRAMQHIFSHQTHILNNLIKRLRHPGQRIHDHMQRLDDLEKRLHLALQNLLQRKTAQLREYQRALEAFSPQEILNRGYAIVSLKETGEILRNANQVKSGYRLVTRLATGAVESTIDTITE